jgi:hypothetical protein
MKIFGIILSYIGAGIMVLSFAYPIFYIAMYVHSPYTWTTLIDVIKVLFCSFGAGVIGFMIALFGITSSETY